MYVLYSLLYTIAMVLISPLFLLRREKYASGFRERLGNYPEFKSAGRRVIWLHCVSVGETNAARPLIDELLKTFPDHSVAVSTTTRTGHELARNLFLNKADAVFYFPFDWKFSVRRALRHFRPSVVLLMETEIWPRLIAEAFDQNVRVAIINARMSERSFRRYRLIRPFIRSVLKKVSLVLAQGETDAARFTSLGAEHGRICVTGNLKFDLTADLGEHSLTDEFRRRFGIGRDRPLIVAASTHEPEEKIVIEALADMVPQDARLLIAPRHPERFGEVGELLKISTLSFVRRSAPPSYSDIDADVILLDTIGELRAVYPLADIVFVGGSLIPHGGQSILEPAASGRAIVTGPFTHNFAEAVSAFRLANALVQLSSTDRADELVPSLEREFRSLLSDADRRASMGERALSVVVANRGAALATVTALGQLIEKK